MTACGPVYIGSVSQRDNIELAGGARSDTAGCLSLRLVPRSPGAGTTGIADSGRLNSNIVPSNSSLKG